MVRILMLGPILIITGLLLSFKNFELKGNKQFNIPFFVFGFIIILILTNSNIIPQSTIRILNLISDYCFLFAMAAIGLNISLKYLNISFKVFIMGLLTFSLQIIFAIYIII